MPTNPAVKIPKRTKWLAAVEIAVILYSVFGFFVVPVIVKSQMLKRLPALTKRQVAIERVKFNPYMLSLTIDGFSLKETNGEVFSSFRELYVNFQLSSIFRRSWVFDEILLQDPFVQITYLKNGTFNFANLIGNSSSAPASQTPQSLTPITVNHLRVTNGAVAFADLTRKSTFKVRYQPINVNLTGFTTLRDQSSPHEIVATGDSGESIGWTGNITVNPLRANGAFRLSGFKLGKYKPYSQDYALFDIVDGQMDASADYSYDSATNALDLNVSNAVINLSRFQLKTPDTGEDVLTIPSLSVREGEASVVCRTARIGQIQSSGGSILVRQNQDGTINLLSNLVPQPSSSSANHASPAGPAWTVKIDEIAFDNYAVKAEDRKPPKPATFNIDQLGFSLKNVSNLSNAPVTVALSLRLQETGLIGVSGAATLIPPSADLQIGVTNLDLRLIQSYLEQQVKVAITRGALNVNGHAQYAPAGQGAPRLAFAGDVSVRDFAVTDEVLFNDLARWDSLDITGIDVALQPDRFQIGQIKFIHPVTSAIIGPDHRLNILTILPDKKAAPPETTSPPTTNTTPIITLGSFVFENAALHFADLSIEPNCTFDVQDSSGSVKGISSLVQTPAVVDVKGNVDQFSSYSVTGKLNPMPDKLFVDVSIAFTNTGLTAFSPYTEVYVGRPLQKGKLSLDLHYQIDQKALTAANNIFIDQLTLGAKNNSTNATKLPVKLAIALFKDRNGRIYLDVPVHGRLDDPKFALWPIIRQIIGNLIAKAVTSPFSFIGAMFGGGDQLSFVAFDPGQADIPAAETNKLNILVKALYERPALSLEINGSVDPAKDREAMARAKLQRQIKALFIKEMTDAGKHPVAMEELKLEPADYERLVAQDYSNTFGAYHPPETNQTPGAAAPPPAKRPGAVSAPVVKNSPLPAGSELDHGGTLMILLSEGGEPIKVPRIPIPASSGQTAKPASPTPLFVPQSELAGMEDQLLQKIDITGDDFGQLMEARASQVEGYLLKSGKVTADRLFITVPKPIGPNSKGEDRVNLPLD
jgi:hypothetical protein